MNVRTAGALQHKCLHKVMKIIGTFENEEESSNVIAFGIVEIGGLTGLWLAIFNGRCVYPGP